MASGLARNSIIVAGLLSAALFLPASFGSEARYEDQEKAPVAFNFKFRQADLQTQRGAHRVYRTLVYKATNACTDRGDSALSLRRTDADCVSALVERVVRQIGSRNAGQRVARHAAVHLRHCAGTGHEITPAHARGMVQRFGVGRSWFRPSAAHDAVAVGTRTSAGPARSALQSDKTPMQWIAI